MGCLWTPNHRRQLCFEHAIHAFASRELLARQRLLIRNGCPTVSLPIEAKHAPACCVAKCSKVFHSQALPSPAGAAGSASYQPHKHTFRAVTWPGISSLQGIAENSCHRFTPSFFLSRSRFPRVSKQSWQRGLGGQRHPVTYNKRISYIS